LIGSSLWVVTGGASEASALRGKYIEYFYDLNFSLTPELGNRAICGWAIIKGNYVLIAVSCIFDTKDRTKDIEFSSLKPDLLVELFLIESGSWQLFFLHLSNKIRKSFLGGP